MHFFKQMGAVRKRHSIRETAKQPVILWIPLAGKPKWLPLNFGFNDVMCTAPINVTCSLEKHRIRNEGQPLKKLELNSLLPYLPLVTTAAPKHAIKKFFMKPESSCEYRYTGHWR